MSSSVVTVTEQVPITEIISLLVNHHISGVPVVDEGKHLIGVVSEKDLLRKLFPSEHDFYESVKFYMNHDRIEKEAVELRTCNAGDVMNRDVICVEPDDHIIRACSLLMLHKIRRLPVVLERYLVGIVTTNDIYKNFLQKAMYK